MAVILQDNCNEALPQVGAWTVFPEDVVSNGQHRFFNIQSPSLLGFSALDIEAPGLTKFDLTLGINFQDGWELFGTDGLIPITLLEMVAGEKIIYVGYVAEYMAYSGVGIHFGVLDDSFEFIYSELVWLVFGGAVSESTPISITRSGDDVSIAHSYDVSPVIVGGFFSDSPDVYGSVGLTSAQVPQVSCCDNASSHFTDPATPDVHLFLDFWEEMFEVSENGYFSNADGGFNIPFTLWHLLDPASDPDSISCASMDIYFEVGMELTPTPEGFVFYSNGSFCGGETWYVQLHLLKEGGDVKLRVLFQDALSAYSETVDITLQESVESTVGFSGSGKLLIRNINSDTMQIYWDGVLLIDTETSGEEYSWGTPNAIFMSFHNDIGVWVKNITHSGVGFPDSCG